MSARFYTAQSDADLPTFWTDEDLSPLLLQLTQFFFVVKWFWKIWVKWTNYSTISDSYDTDCKLLHQVLIMGNSKNSLLKILEVFLFVY